MCVINELGIIIANSYYSSHFYSSASMFAASDESMTTSWPNVGSQSKCGTKFIAQQFGVLCC